MCPELRRLSLAVVRISELNRALATDITMDHWHTRDVSGGLIEAREGMGVTEVEA